MSEMSKEFIKKKEIFNENKNSFSHNIPNVLSRISFEFENDIVWSQLLWNRVSYTVVRPVRRKKL